MSLRTDWHYVASVIVCWGEAVAFAPGDRVPDEFIRTGLVPLSAVIYDPTGDSSPDRFTDRLIDTF